MQDCQLKTCEYGDQQLAEDKHGVTRFIISPWVHPENGGKMDLFFFRRCKYPQPYEILIKQSICLYLMYV